MGRSVCNRSVVNICPYLSGGEKSIIFILCASPIIPLLIIILYNGFRVRQINKLSGKEVENNEMTNITVEEVLSFKKDETFPNTSITFAFQWYKSLTTNARVCRFHNSCITRNGTMLLHPYLRSYDSLISSECKIVYRFMKSSTEYNSTSFSSQFDLLGYFFPRSHMPHFLYDFLGRLGVYDIITDESNNVESICISEHGNITCPKIDSKFRFAFFLPDKDRGGKFSSWIPQFLTIFSDYWFFYSPKEWFNKMDEEVECFRSIIRQFGSGKLHSTDWFQKTNLKKKLAHGDNIARWSLTSMFKKNALGSRTCNPNILIVNRKKQTGRDISNVKDVESIAQATVRKYYNDGYIPLELSRESKSLHFRSTSIPSVKTIFMEDLSFRSQAEHIRNADIIIGTHGAGLTNLIFARKDVLVYEIYPFMYYPPNFLHLSQEVKLNYFSMIASPDSESYIDCIQKFSIRNPNVSKLALPVWNRGLFLWKRDRNCYQKELESDSEFRSYNLELHKRPEIAFIQRVCLRSQHLKVDVHELGNQIKNGTKYLCNTKSAY